METQHTKGEWKATEPIPKIDGDRIKIIGRTRESEYCVGEVFYIDSLTEMEANARLISASPDMLEALQKIIDLKEKALNTEDLFPVLKAIEESKTALNKALGQS